MIDKFVRIKLGHFPNHPLEISTWIDLLNIRVKALMDILFLLFYKKDGAMSYSGAKVSSIPFKSSEYSSWQPNRELLVT